MKSTIQHSIAAGVILLVLFLSTPLGQVKMGYAQADTGWSEPINLSNSGASTDPSIVIDSTGVIHVIWLDAVDGYKYVNSKDGVKWSAPITVDFPFDPETDSRPTLIADESGSIHIFWTQPRSQFEVNSPDELFYGRTSSIFLSQPLSWAVVGKIADSVLDFDVEADSRSVIHLSYVGNLATDDDPAGIFYRRLDGKTWGPAVRLYSSQYFRTLSLEESHVRLAVTGGGRTGNVHVVWDDRPARRIFLASSLDGGVNWQENIQLYGPENSNSLELPYNVDVSATGKNVLLTWQLGQPDSSCSLYSQWSMDGAESFGDSIRVSDEIKTCPTSSMFIGNPPGYFLLMPDLYSDLFFIAWNGTNWSSLQPQPELNTFTNPNTLDDVVMGCRQVADRTNNLFLVGCDQSGGGDIWFTTRSLGPVGDWYPPPSAWSAPTIVTNTPQRISLLASTSDNENNIHALWAQSPISVEEAETTIQYAKWDGQQWSNPVSIFTGLRSAPSQLVVTMGGNRRLLLVWVAADTGDLLFSWASSERALIPSEWIAPKQLPTPSPLISSPDILVDAAGRIVVAYAIPLNEERGVYIVQTTDFGETWSVPTKAFDAASAGWESLDQPKITLDGDGRMHLLFTRYTVRGKYQSTGLFYSQSADGGVTWGEPEVVSERAPYSSDIVSYGQEIVHRNWQEENGTYYVFLNQTSQDGGLSWGEPVYVTSLMERVTRGTLIPAGNGQLYFIQLVENENLVMQEWGWDSALWKPLNSQTLLRKSENFPSELAATIAPNGTFNVLISTRNQDSTGKFEDGIIDISRQLEPPESIQSGTQSLIPTSVPVAIPSLSSNSEGTPTQSLINTNDSGSFPQALKNTIGFVLLGVILILAAIIFRPKGRKGSD